MAPLISLVIPCYNEAGNLAPLIDRCQMLVSDADAEVVLVDNGSSDDTGRILSDLAPASPGAGAVRSIRVRVNRGYGHGILAGLAEARGRFLGWTHADMQTDPCDVLLALPLLPVSDSEPDRFLKGMREGRSAFDRVFTRGMSLFELVALGHWMPDINGQPTLFSRRFYESWCNPPRDFSLDLFAFCAALEGGLQVHRIPTVFAPRHSGQGHNDLLRSKLRYSSRTIAYSLALRRARRRGDASAPAGAP